MSTEPDSKRFKMSHPSFIAYAVDCDFPLQNLPYGVFSLKSSPAVKHIGCAIGDLIIDLHACAARGLFVGNEHLETASQAIQQPVLNAFMSLGRPAWKALRAAVTSLLSADNATIRDNQELRDAVLIKLVCSFYFVIDHMILFLTYQLGMTSLMLSCTCRLILVITLIFTRPSNMPTMSESCSAVRPTRCSPTGTLFLTISYFFRLSIFKNFHPGFSGCTCRSVITVAPPRLSCPALT
jgi:hypothetical protein